MFKKNLFSNMEIKPEILMNFINSFHYFSEQSFPLAMV